MKRKAEGGGAIRDEEYEAVHMQTTIPNLLVSLFTWRPRDSVTPGENFLTEAFVHTLRVNASFRSKWLTQLLGQTINDSSLAIETRTSHANVDSGTTVFPDVDIRGEFASGASFNLLIEIKWGAAYVASQLIKYDRLLTGKPNPHLAFLCARGTDYRSAINDAAGFVHSEFHPLLWETVFVALQSAASNCQISKEFLGFMDHHGLSPGQPISTSMAKGYIASKPIFERFHRYAEKLLREFDWTILPATHRETDSVKVRNRYGRVAIEFAPPGWNGAITVGFLYDNNDHAVPFADGTSNSIDLMMRIEAAKAKDRKSVNTAIKARMTAVRRAGGVVRVEGDGVNKNTHTLFIAQRSLTDFLSSPVEGDQLQALYGQLKAWSEALFSDGTVSDALAQLVRERAS